MKKVIKIIITALLLAVSLSLFACGGVDSIYFEKEPRTTYIQGQDFVLDDAVLVALSGKKTETVDLSQVVVSGYDKNKLGDQTVTVTYDEQSVSITVNVIPRMSFEGVVNNYFVGDTFDKTKGRIRVADDSGKITTVNMSDSKVTVDGFDASAPAIGKAVTVQYGSYSGSFTVNIYEAETVELTAKPKKTSYYSHDTEFSTLGAYFTVTANSGILNNLIELTPDMISGFDPGAATVANYDTPLSQTVKISYLGRTFDFTISIRYSAVSLMEFTAEKFKDVDPFNATAEQSQEAMAAIEKYMEISKADKALVSNEAKTAVVKVAICHAYNEYLRATERFADSFSITATEGEDGKTKASVIIDGGSYEGVAADLACLKDENDPFVALADTLRDIKAEFADIMVTETENVDKYLGTVYNEADLKAIIEIFELMTELHDHLDSVPENWTVEELDDHESDIKNAVITLSNSVYNPFKLPSYSTLFDIVSSWRTKNDYFEIIYAYYLEYENDKVVEALWEKVPFPTQLQTVYQMIRYGLNFMNTLKVGTDTTPFMYYYYTARSVADDIKNGDNQLHIDIYNRINFESLISSYLFIGNSVNNIAYVYHVSSLLDNDRYDDFLDKYIEIIRMSLASDEDFYKGSDVQQKAKELYNMYIDFTPAEQFAFLGALHCDYRFYEMTKPVMGYNLNDDGEVYAYNWFGDILYKAYEEMLSDEAFDVFARLLVATETYALRYRFEGRLDTFLEEMEGIIEDAAALSADELAPFAFALEKFTMIYNECKTPSIIDSDELDELRGVIETFFELYNHSKNGELTAAEREVILSLVFATNERAKLLAKDILSSGEEDVIYAYLYGQYNFDIESDVEYGDNVARTFDSVIDEMSYKVYNYLIVSISTVVDSNKDETKYNAFSVYYNSGISEFLEKAYDIMLAEYRGVADELSIEYVFSVMNAYRQLSENAIFGINAMSADTLYFDGILHCIEAYLSDADADVAALVKMLLEAERSYAEYITLSDDEVAENEFKADIVALMEAYEQLADKSAFSDFKEMYDYYVEKYNNISEDDGSSGGTGVPPVDPTPGGDSPLDPTPGGDSPLEPTPGGDAVEPTPTDPEESEE